MSDKEAKNAAPGEPEEKPRIKVTDRRMFDREGNLRQPPASDNATPESGAPRELGEADPSSMGAAEGTAERAAHPAAHVGDEGIAKGEAAVGSDAAAGEMRGEATATASAPAEATEGAPTSAAPPLDAPSPSAAAPETSEGAGDEAGGRRVMTPGGPSAADLPRDFVAFVESQYFESLLFLGAIPHPHTQEVIEDLDMARYKIDLLEMLQTKTEGNLEPEEKKALEDVLYQLRMAYLQKSKVTKL